MMRHKMLLEEQMPDISMCCNYKCPMRSKCYRYMARPSPYNYQAYGDFQPNGNTCDDFWDCSGRVIDNYDTAEKRNKKLYDRWNKERKK